MFFKLRKRSRPARMNGCACVHRSNGVFAFSCCDFPVTIAYENRFGSARRWVASADRYATLVSDADWESEWGYGTEWKGREQNPWMCGSGSRSCSWSWFGSGSLNPCTECTKPELRTAAAFYPISPRTHRGIRQPEGRKNQKSATRSGCLASATNQSIWTLLPAACHNLI